MDPVLTMYSKPSDVFVTVYVAPLMLTLGRGTQLPLASWKVALTTIVNGLSTLTPSL